MERHEIEQHLTRELARDERLLWSGRPKQGIMFRASDMLLIPFSLLWCGFAIFWESGVLTSDAPFFFKIWGIPFVCIGLYIVFGRFVADSLERKKTIYGLTNERVIIVSRLFRQTVRSLYLRTISDVAVTQHRDGTGTITFGRSGGYGRGGRQTAPPAFEGIDEARSVYEQLRAAQKTA